MSNIQVLTIGLLILLSLIGWHYIGYPLILTLLPKNPNLKQKNRELPTVSIIIAAYNEEETISDRIVNCLESDYPANKLEIIIGSDGSSDQTVEEARSIDDDRIMVLDFDENRGRSSVHNDCVRQASGEILMFTDADTRYHEQCVRRLAESLRNSEVGAVCGHLRTNSFEGDSIGEGMGLYWKWEYKMRSLQSSLGILTKMTGANMAMRKSLYKKLPAAIDIDQAAGFLAYLDGKRCRYIPSAIAYEQFPTEPKDELATRRRLTTQALTSITAHRAALNPLSYPKQFLNTGSYWVLRYLIPFLLLGIFSITVILSYLQPIFLVVLVPQALFYISAIIGMLFERRGKTVRPFSFIFSYCWANYGVLLGVLDFLGGTRVNTYQPR